VKIERHISLNQPWLMRPKMAKATFTDLRNLMRNLSTFSLAGIDAHLSAIVKRKCQLHAKYLL